MVDNLAEKVDECPMNWGRYVLLMYNLDPENCLLYGEERCPLFRSCLSIEVNGRTARTSRIALLYCGCPLLWGSTVFMHTSCTHCLVPRPLPSFPSLAIQLSGRGPGTFSHVSDIMGRKTLTECERA